MEEGYSEERQASFRKFLNGFVGENDSFSAQDDPIQFRGSVVGSFRLHVNDIPAEIHDWVQLYLFQRKCPHDLALLLAREVQSRIEAFLPSIVPTLTNGGTAGTDSPDEGSYLLDSSMLYREMLSELNQVCSQLVNSETELAAKSATCRTPQYQTSLVAVKNTRRKMEDRHVLVHDLSALCGLVDGPSQSYYAIFDGHAGAEAANFCSAHLHWNLVQNPKFECDPESALREAFAITEDQFDQRSQREGIKSGCTAVCCLIREKQLYLAWLGDSQAILVKKGMPVTIMDPHKPERLDEKARVEKMGGCVMQVGIWRVNGILAVSRALGDFEYKPCISSEPDINKLNLDGDEDFLVLACDGLWDTLTPNDVTASVYHYISQVDHIDDIAALVAQQAIERGSTDNVTVIIVFLRDLQTLAAQCAVTSFSSEPVTNYGSTMLEEINNELESKGLVFENGDGEYNFSFKSETENVHTGNREHFYQKLGGFAPEQTSISELPTPPIEDLMDAEGMECRKNSSNPFESNDNIEIHDSHAKEIASAILTSALESAALGDNDFTKTGGLCELDSGLQRFTESAFFSGQLEVNPPLGTLSESGNTVEAQKPWVLQVQHSSEIDEVDYLPSSNPFEMASHGPDAFGQFPEYYVSDKDNLVDPFSSLPDKVDAPKSQDLVVPAEHLDTASISVEHDLLGDLLSQSTSNSNAKNELQNTAEPSLFLEEESVDVQVLSPEMLKEAEIELKEVHSVLLQSAEVLAKDDQSYVEAFTSMQSRFELQSNEQLLELADKQLYCGDLPHEKQLANLNPFEELQPEMMGNAEVLSGDQSSEHLIALEPVKTLQQDVLAVFEDVLVPSTPDQGTAAVEKLLEFSLEETRTTKQEEVMEVPETPERVSNLTLTISPTSASTVPVQSNLLVDFIAPQMIVPELNDPKAVANLLASDVPPTPEVVLERIPDGVPEADGVTEDSDSEKDGGWSYVSAKANDPKTDEATLKKTKPGVATTVKRTNGTAKEVTKSSSVSRTGTVKPAESKLKTKPATSKLAAQAGPTTLKKTPSDPAKKPATSTLIKSKPSPTTAIRVSAGTSKTATVSTKEVEVKASVTKTSTVSRPNATLSKKTTTTTAKPPSAGVTAAATKTTQSTTTAATKANTLKSNKTLSATSTIRSAAAATTSTRPASSTLNKPPPKPTSATRPASATNSATLSKKPETNIMSKSSTNTLVKVSPARPLSTLTKTQKANAEIKQTKETVNKQLVNQPGTLKNKLNSLATNKSSSKTGATTTTLTKSSTLRTAGSKTTKSVMTSSKTVTKTTVKVENEEVQKVLIDGEATRSETEKGSLEDTGKESQAVDSGLASPESPVSLQLSLVNGNHQVDAPVEEVTAVFEQVELN